MKMKLLFCGLGLALVTTQANAQASFGLRGGVNFQNLTGKDFEGDKLNNDLKVGFNAGFNVEFPVAEDFYLQPGILFSTKGAKFEDSDTKINLSYVEVPINFIYKPELGTGKMLLGFGPYVGFAVGGSIKPEGGGEDIDIEFKNKITTEEALLGGTYMRRMDAGANLLVGYEFASRFSFQLNAQLGLTNLAPKIEDVSEDPGPLKNTGFGLSLGYRF